MVEANSNFDRDLFPAIATAINLGVKFISLSWGGTEFEGQVDADATLNHRGVAITAATGDDGFGVSFPASSPFVTAVGGTSLVAAQNARGWTESAWSGAGSGCSTVEAKPAFQTDPGCPNRTIADVAAVADPATGVAVYNTFSDNGWHVFGGTSAATLIRGHLRAGRQPGGALRQRVPVPQFVERCTTWTVGSNGACGGSYLCTGQVGYDGPTGLGTPRERHAVLGPDASRSRP